MSDGVTEVEILVYANEDYSDVSKTIKIIFTDGYAKTADFEQSEITLKVGESFIPTFGFTPFGANAKSVVTTIKNQYRVDENKDVAIVQAGEIVAQNGGRAEIEICVTLYDGSTKTFKLTVVVQSFVQNIEFCAILTSKTMFSSQVSQLLLLIMRQVQVTRQMGLLSGKLLVVPQQFLEIASNLVRRVLRLLLAEVRTRTKK